MTRKKSETKSCACFACGAQFTDQTKLNTHLNECPPMLAWREQIRRETHQQIGQLQDEILMIASSHDSLRKDVNGLKPKYKPWYTSIGTWIAILLFAGMCYLIYAFVMSELGYNIKMPTWFISTLKALIPH